MESIPTDIDVCTILLCVCVCVCVHVGMHVHICQCEFSTCECKGVNVCIRLLAPTKSPCPVQSNSARKSFEADLWKRLFAIEEFHLIPTFLC